MSCDKSSNSIQDISAAIHAATSDSYILTQADFAAPYVIDKPGIYSLGEDIKFLFYPEPYDIFNVETMKFVYDSVNKTNPSTHLYNTAAIRNSNLNSPLVRTVTYGIKSLKYTRSVLWNTLPITIRNTPPRKVFTKKLRIYKSNPITNF